MFKTIEDFQKLSKDQFEAATKSATAFSNSMQSFVSETAEFARKSLETGSDAMQKLLGSRSVETAMQIQMDYAKTAYDNVVAESGKLGGMMTTAAQDVFRPLQGAFAQVQSATLPTATL